MDSLPSTEPSLKGIPLYRGLDIQVIIPNPPNIPIAEGLHIKVTGSHDSSIVLKQYWNVFLLGLGSAKAIAESGQTTDFWANTRIESGQQVSAYGRVPTNENSWRKPVDTAERTSSSADTLDDLYDQQKLQKLFARYMPLWENLGKHITLFENGGHGKLRKN